jgi:hypothetical protein
MNAYVFGSRMAALVLGTTLAIGCYDGGAHSAGGDPASTAGNPAATAPSANQTGSTTATPPSAGSPAVTNPPELPGLFTALHLEGELGDVSDVLTDTLEIQGEGTSIRLDALMASPDRWIMTRLNFNPALTDARWAPGTAVEIGEDAAGGGTDALSVFAIGCSGPMRDRYHYDGPPHHGHVHVGHGHHPHSIIVSFVLYWDNAGGRPGAVSGSFEYEPR